MGRQLNIWVLTNEYGPTIIGGLGTVATELSRSLIRRNVKVKVWTKGSSPSINHWVQQHGISSLPDVVHIHSLEFAATAIRLKRQYRIPILYTCHSLVSMEASSKHPRWKQQTNLIRHADRVVVPSNWLRNQLVRFFPRQRSKFRVIPNGVKIGQRRAAVPQRKLLFLNGSCCSSAD